MQNTIVSNNYGLSNFGVRGLGDPNVRVSKIVLPEIGECSESRSIDRGVKESSTTQMATWARKPHSHVSKSFAMSRLDFGQGVWKGDSYRQSALIPTFDAPDLTIQ